MAAMSRIGALLALLATTAPAQRQEPEPFVVLLRDPAGMPVAGARAAVHAHPSAGSTVLRDFPFAAARIDGLLPELRLAHSGSDARGELRLRPAHDATFAAGVVASGWVETENGLGALLADLQPGRAQRVDMQPMAAVTTEGASELLAIRARATLDDGRRVDLRPRPAAVVRLPAGSYELWIHTSSGWLWQRLLLVAGERHVLRFEAPARRLQSPASAAFHPAGRPDAPLFAHGASETTLLGDAARAPMVTVFGNEVFGPSLLPAPRDDGTVYWPAPEQRAATVRLHPVPEAEGLPMATFSVARQADGSWRLLGASGVRGTRAAFAGPSQWFELPARPPGSDVWLLFAAAGHALQAKPWDGTAATFPFALERGVPLSVSARDETGQPVENLLLEYAPVDMDPAAVEGRSDARGTARLGPVLAPGTLRVSDPRFANQDLTLAAIPTGGVAVTVTAGEPLRGTAWWADGAPARGVLVTVRDPSGGLRPAQRTTSTDAGGGFVFAGLPDDRPLLLFATALREGRTWSGKLVGLRAGGGAVELLLRDEDPQLLPPAGR